MSRITGSEVANLMEAYSAVYTPSFTTSLNNIYIPEEVSNLFEGCLTEEFISEAYYTVADYLVSNGFVPGYNTAELFMSEMAVEDIDLILFETGILSEQYLLEAGFFQNLGAGADRFVGGVAGGVKRAAQTVSGAAQRAGQTAVRAGQAAAGAAQRAGQTVSRAVTPVAQAVKGTAQRAVSAGQSALNTAGRAVSGAAQGVARGATAAGQAVAGGVQRAGQAVAGAAGNVARKVGQEIEISRRVGAGLPPTAGGSAVAKTAPQRIVGDGSAAGKPGAAGGTTTPKGSSVTSTGVSGLSPANRAAYSAGGGNAAAQKGMGQTTAQVIAQGKANLGRMDQGKTAPATARPTSGPSSVNPKSGLSAAPARPGTTPVKPAGTPPTPTQVTASKPGMVGSSPEVKATNTAAANPSSGTTPVKPAGTPPTPTQATAKKPSLASGVQDLRQMRAASQQRIMSQGGTPATALVQSFDPFDVVLGHLMSEGYADTEEAALAIMANMSEEWRKSILEEADPIDVDFKPQRLPNGKMPKPTPQQSSATADALKLRARVGLKGV